MTVLPPQRAGPLCPNPAYWHSNSNRKRLDVMAGNLMQIAGTVAYLAAGVVLWRARSAFADTTVGVAWYGALLAWLAWGAAWFSQVFAAGPLPPIVSELWYLTAVLALCPPVAVLGARRPGARVWTIFILLPMVVVLSWPALAQFPAVWRGSPLQLEAPTLVGFALVTVMGLGNYVGTRFSLSAILLGIAVACIVGPLGSEAGESIARLPMSRFWATACLGAAALLAAFTRATAHPVPSSLDRVWIDFRNLFGVVWSKRLIERVNDTAQREGWPARMEMHGIVWHADHVTAEQQAWTRQRVEHTLRWLLRRFVDPEWIDRRLSLRQPQGLVESGADGGGLPLKNGGRESLSPAPASLVKEGPS